MLEYLSQFSDPQLVKEHLAAVQTKEFSDREAELAGIEQALSKLAGQFLQNLDLLRREVITEPEFVKANDATRGQVFEAVKPGSAPNEFMTQLPPKQREATDVQ